MDTKTMTISEKADELYKFFETKKRGEESIVVLKDNRPESLLDSVHAAHGDRLPDDWIYSTYQAILSSISDSDIKDESALDDARAEIVDDLVDVYTHDLTTWLNRSVYNVHYIDEAVKEYGFLESGAGMLMRAQYMAIDEIFSEVAKYLTAPRDIDS